MKTRKMYLISILSKVLIQIVVISFPIFLFSQNYDALRASDTIPMIKGISGKSIILKREVIKSVDSIEVSIEGFKVCSFEFSCIQPGDMTILRIKGNLITDEIKKYICNKKVYNIVFTNIKVIDKVGNIYKPKLHEIKITIL